MVVPIIASALVLRTLLRDHKRDPGLHKTAKTAQVVCLTFLAFYTGSAPLHLLQTFSNLEANTSFFSSGENVVLNTIQQLSNALYQGTEIAILILVFFMARRSNQARRVFLFVLPLFALLESVVQLRLFSWLLYDVTSNPWAVFAITVLAVTGTGVAILLLYVSKIMRDFFVLEANNPFAPHPNVEHKSKKSPESVDDAAGEEE